MSRCPLDSIEMSECQNYTCPSFYYAYGDGSFVRKLYEDVLELPMSAPPSLTVENFTFGCAHEALAEPVGVAGFGRRALSLSAQLSAYSPKLGSQFSYCLISHSFDSHRVTQPSSLILGRRVNPPLKVNKVKQSGYKRVQEVEDKPI
nr:probable aspartyl protease At4g16563 [Tanacetum cinerariifolium]